MRTRQTSQQKMLPALTRFLVLAAVVLSMLFYGLGGWYFAGVLETEALVIDPWELDFDVRVTAASDETVALEAEEGSNAYDDGWFGLSWDGGSGLMGPIVEFVGAGVVRQFVHSEGRALTAGTMVAVDPWMWADPESGYGQPFDEVEFSSPLGTFEAWEVDAGTSQWMIAVHGKGATRREGLRIASIAHRAGYNVLLIDYRNDAGAPQDPSGQYRYGASEWEDLEAAVEYVQAQRASNIVIAGLSTGGAVTMSFLYRSEAATSIDGVILESPNIDMVQTVRHGASQTPLPVIGLAVPDSLATAAMWFAERRYDVDFDEWDYLTDADLLATPVLVIHGDSDDRVPHAVSVDLVTARPDLVTYQEFADAGHVESWNSDRDRYSEIVTEFLSGDE